MKLGIVCDYLEEGWISMDICAQMLHDRALNIPDLQIQPALIRPNFQWRLKSVRQYIPKYFNGNRFINRFIDYPQYLRSQANDYDLFHIADHSYAHLVHSLPAANTGVFCYDLNAFQSILEPELYPRSRYYRWMSQHILTGMQTAAIVFYCSNEIRQQIESHQIVDPARLVAAPLGVSAEYQPRSFPPEPTNLTIANLQARLQGKPFVLHVGSCVPRKRIDVLLATFAELRSQVPELQLVKVGGMWSAAQQEQIEKLALEQAIVHLTDLPNSTIATLYQQAQIVLLPSDAEGFGLPVIEALACGAIVIASDIPVLREVGGDAVIYCPSGDIGAWVARSLAAIENPTLAPALAQRLDRAACYSWDRHAYIVMEAYSRLGSGQFRSSGAQT